MEDHCVMCGEIVPEGRQVCPLCEKKYGETDETEEKTVFHSKKPGYKRGPAPIHKEGSG